jgi:hypothetical protein
MIISLQIVIMVLLFIWLIALTLLYTKMRAHYNHLLDGGSKRQLQVILEEILKDQSGIKKHIAELQVRCDKIEKDGKLHIQKVGLVRFNPFKDTGGDQSFIIALINAQNTGVVISGLYSRMGTRWYAKKVEKGIGVDHTLSSEENKALEVAMNEK